MQKALKQADLDTLKLAAQEGHIELKYLDEAVFLPLESSQLQL